MSRSSRCLLGLALTLGLALFGAIHESSPRADDPFERTAVDGTVVDFRELRRGRWMLGFFSFRLGVAEEVLRSWEAVHARSAPVGVPLIGVCLDDLPDAEVRRRLNALGARFPVLTDREGKLRAQYRPEVMPQVLYFEAGWRTSDQAAGYPDPENENREAAYRALLLGKLGLKPALAIDPSETPWPSLPSFEARDNRGARLDLESLAGKVSLVTFVGQRCPYCREQLLFFRSLLSELGPERLRILAILVDADADPALFRDSLELPFPVVADPRGKLQADLGFRGAVPDTYVVDGRGRVRHRHVSFETGEPDLYRMELRHLLGLPNEVLLPEGFAGVRRCRICHESEYWSWRSSGHARAFETLSAKGKSEDPECVGCHVVGWQQPNGYASNPADLRDVQCEACHGPGGPHAGTVSVKPITASTCEGCHDAKHSVGFELDRALPLVDHHIDVGTTPEEAARADRLRAELKAALMRPVGGYLGAGACQTCHPAIYERWSVSGHARAGATLRGRAEDPAACERCHATGAESPWAFLPGPPDRATRAGVQCEACHGPGEKHLAAADPVARRESILGLSGKCEDCVIELRCHACHDPENDPDFDFEAARQRVGAMCAPDRAEEDD